MTEAYRTWTKNSKTYRRYTNRARRAAVAFGKFPARTDLRVQSDYRTGAVTNLCELVANANLQGANYDRPHGILERYRGFTISVEAGDELVNRLAEMQMRIVRNADGGWDIQDNADQDWMIEITGTNKTGVTATDVVTPEIVRKVVRDALNSRTPIA